MAFNVARGTMLHKCTATSKKKVHCKLRSPRPNPPGSSGVLRVCRASLGILHSIPCQIVVHRARHEVCLQTLRGRRPGDSSTGSTGGHWGPGCGDGGWPRGPGCPSQDSVTNENNGMHLLIRGHVRICLQIVMAQCQTNLGKYKP